MECLWFVIALMLSMDGIKFQLFYFILMIKNFNILKKLIRFLKIAWLQFLKILNIPQIPELLLI